MGPDSKGGICWFARNGDAAKQAGRGRKSDAAVALQVIQAQPAFCQIRPLKRPVGAVDPQDGEKAHLPARRSARDTCRRDCGSRVLAGLRIPIPMPSGTLPRRCLGGRFAGWRPSDALDGAAIPAWSRSVRSSLAIHDRRSVTKASLADGCDRQGISAFSFGRGLTAPARRRSRGHGRSLTV